MNPVNSRYAVIGLLIVGACSLMLALGAAQQAEPSTGGPAPTVGELGDLNSLLQTELKKQDFCPVGTIVAYAGSVLPSDAWLWCDGRPVGEGKKYDELKTRLGQTYCQPGETIVRVPDLRGRFPLASGAAPGLTERAMGQTAGEESHVITLSQMPRHNHDFSDPGHVHKHDGPPEDKQTFAGFGGAFPGSAIHFNIGPSGGSQIGERRLMPSSSNVVVNFNGGDQPVPIMPPFCVVNYIIRAY